MLASTLHYANRFRQSGQLPFNFDELIVDNFAGGGGASTGIEMAMGRPIDIAINHDPGAIKMHEVNHPHTKHYCESVWDVNPREVCAGRPVGLAWFSPDCKHFSKAKGGKPVEKKIRGLAWVVLRWAATVKPRVIMLENVEEFVTWSPLITDSNGDSYPDPKRKGQTFKSFVNALRRHGYEVDWKELRACDYGAPTIRKRLFLVARCDGQPIAWPEATHADPRSIEVKSKKLKAWRTTAECMDWDAPAPSIFDRSRPLVDATLKRIAKGIMRYVVENPNPFIVPSGSTNLSVVTPFITEHANASNQRNMPADEPLRTQCAQVKGGHFALCSALLVKHYTGVVGHEIDKPAGTVTTADHHSLVTASLVRQFGQSVGSDVNEPMGTITAGGLGKTGLVTSHLVKLRGTCRDGQMVTAPMPTITASGTHVGEVRTFLQEYTVGNKNNFGIVTISGEKYQIVDIGMRMLNPRELFRAQGFPEDYIIDRDSRGVPITKTDQVKRCGNSVSPYPAEALVRANMQPAVTLRKAA